MRKGSGTGVLSSNTASSILAQYHDSSFRRVPWGGGKGPHIMHIENTEQRWRDMQEVLAEGGARKNTQEDRELVRERLQESQNVVFTEL
jgi:hypothetical protein